MKMLCKTCMTVMKTGTAYHPKKDERDSGYKRFHECKKCGDKIFTNEPNFQEFMNKAIMKRGSR